MKKTMAFMIAAVSGAALCLGAFAGNVIPEYANEFEAPWFDAGVEGYTAGQTLPTEWTKPTSAATDPDVVKVNAGSISLDTDLDDPLSYQPAEACEDVAVVTATFTVTPNVEEPELGDSQPQAALTVVNVGGASKWAMLVGTAQGGRTWQTVDSPVPEANQSYSIRIEFDQRNGEPRQIRYFVGDTMLGAGWYPNPKAEAVNISKVSFSGSGDITALAGKSVLNASVSLAEGEGYDFTNGTITVTSVDVGGVAGAKAKLTVFDHKSGAEITSYEQKDIGADPVEWDLAEGPAAKKLLPGDAYDYKVEVIVGGETVASGTGTFVAANWAALFGAKVEGGDPVVTGGEWADVPEIDKTNNAYLIDDEAVFNINSDVQAKEADHITRVDVNVTFDVLVDANSLVKEADALGGFVAAKNGDVKQWEALTSTGWVVLTGAPSPAEDTPYVIRAEVDCLAEANKRVRYSVSSDNAVTFLPLSTAAGDEWIPFADTTKAQLAKVELQGTGTLKQFEAKVTDAAVAKDAAGNEYATLWEALIANKGAVTLLTNATLSPSGTITKGTYHVTKGAYGLVVDTAAFGKDWKVTVGGDGTITVEHASVGATYRIW